jgi:hypothetical protein
MFHLFNKAYVVPDFMVTTLDASWLISANALTANLYDKHTGSGRVFVGIDHMFATSAFKDWPSLFSYLMTSNDDIYADARTTAEICVALIKTLFPNITPAVAWRIYNTCVQRITLHTVSEIMSRSHIEDRRRLLEGQTKLNRLDFSAVFDTIVPWPDDNSRRAWVTEHISEFSLEFHIATFFTTPSHLKHFKDKYIQFIVKACYTEVREWYDVFTIHCMQPIAKQALGHNITWDTEDWRAELKMLPELGWLFDDEFRFALNDPVYLFTHIEEAHKLGQLTLKFIQLGTVMHHMAMNRNVHKHTLIDADYFESDHAQFVFKTLDKLLINLGHFSDQEIETYIEEDIKDETVSTIFDLLNSHYKYNTWMMHFIYDMRANNNPDLYQLRISI